MSDYIWVKYKETRRDAEGRHATNEKAKQVPAKLGRKPERLKNQGYTIITEAEANRINGIAAENIAAANAEKREKKSVADAPAADNGLGSDSDALNIDDNAGTEKQTRGRKPKTQEV